MFSRIIICTIGVLLLPITAFSQIPFDMCGYSQFIDVEGGCWAFLADNGEVYEGVAYEEGIHIRVIGTYHPMASICMVGACCLFVDTVMLCDNCCAVRGNVDGIVGTGGPIDVCDVSFLAAYLFRGGVAPICLDEGNVDGEFGVPPSYIDVADLTYLVDYMWKAGPPPPPCVIYEP